MYRLPQKAERLTGIKSRLQFETACK